MKLSHQLFFLFVLWMVPVTVFMLVVDPSWPGVIAVNVIGGFVGWHWRRWCQRFVDWLRS